MLEMFWNWKTTLFGIVASASIYMTQIHGPMPVTRDEWIAMLWAMAVFVWGSMSRDEV